MKMTPRSRLVPYITAREGDVADSFVSLRPTFDATGRPHLSYWDETRQDHAVNGVLWSRVSQSIGDDGLLGR